MHLPSPMALPLLPRPSVRRSLRRGLLGLAATTGLALAGTAGLLAGRAPLVPPAQAQGTPGLLEFRWDNNKDYRKLYFFMTDTQRLKRCRMSEGGMLSRTRCLEQIPATIELAENGSALEIFPDTPIPDTGTIGVYMLLFNPFNVGMYQFNALAQAPGDVPISGYLGSWLIQIDPPSN
jgi:hypothetical protein